MDVFNSRAVLFESGEEEEALRIECAITQEGALEIVQESAGPLTEWCFEETPHRISAFVNPTDVLKMLDYFHIDESRHLPLAIRLEYTGYDCFRRLRTLMRRLSVPYEVREVSVAR